MKSINPSLSPCRFKEFTPSCRFISLFYFLSQFSLKDGALLSVPAFWWERSIGLLLQGHCPENEGPRAHQASLHTVCFSLYCYGPASWDSPAHVCFVSDLHRTDLLSDPHSEFLCKDCGVPPPYCSCSLTTFFTEYITAVCSLVGSLGFSHFLCSQVLNLFCLPGHYLRSEAANSYGF